MEMQKVKYYKIILALLGLFFFCTSAISRDGRNDSTFFISAKGGILYTQLKDHLYYSDFSPEFSSGYGFEANWLPDKEYGFTAGLVFNQRKFSIDNRFPVYNRLGEQIDLVRANYNFNFLTMPVTARYNFGEIFNVYIDAGIVFNFMLSAKRYAYRDSLPPETYKPGNYENNINEDHLFLYFSITGGGGLEYFINPRLAVFADYKYIMDITRLYSDKNIAGGVKPKMFLHKISIGLRYGIPVKQALLKNTKHYKSQGFTSLPTIMGHYDH